MFNTLQRLNQARIDFFSSPARSYPFAFFAVLALLIAYYFASVVPRAQRRIIERDFRILATASDQMRLLVENYVLVLQTMVDRENTDRKRTDDIETLNALSQDPHQLFVDCEENYDKNRGSGTILRIASHAAEEAMRVEYRPAADTTHPQSPSAGQSDNKAQVLCLEIPSDYTQSIVDSIVQKHPDRFESAALALSDGRILYQRARDGFRLNNIGSLLERQFDAELNDKVQAQYSLSVANTSSDDKNILPLSLREADWREVSFTGIISTEVGNQRYRLLIQPVHLQLHAEAATSSAEHRPTLSFLLIGVLSSDKLESAARSPEPSTIGWVVGVVSLALLTVWPVLKVWKMSATDYLTRKETVYLSFSLIAAISLGTLLGLDQLIRGDTKDIERQLVNLSDAVQSHLSREVEQVLELIDSANSSTLLHDNIKSSRTTRYEEVSDLLSRPDVGQVLLNKYPWFDQVAWLNKQGDQIVKWASKSRVTPQTAMRSYDFFVKVRQGDVWSLVDGNSTTPFLLTAIDSPNTAAYLPIVVKPLLGPTSIQPAETAIVSTFLLSLNNPVLPPNFGFAIVDDQGDVKFQSDAARNDRENMLNRVDSPSILRSAMSARSDSIIDTTYLDSHVIMNVRPLSGMQPQKALIYRCPWTLITWYSMDAREAFIIRVFGLSFACLSFYFAYLAVLCVTFWRNPNYFGGLGGHHSDWYLPLARKLPNLVLLAITLLSLTVICQFLLGTRSVYLLGACAVLLWSVILIVPPLGLVLVRRILTWEKVCLDQNAPMHPALTKVIFVISALLIGTLLGSVPTVAFTRLIWNHERISYAKTNQLKLQHALDERVESARMEAAKLQTDEISFKGEPRCEVYSGDYELCETERREQFVQRRLSQELDRYDLESLNVGVAALQGGEFLHQTSACEEPGQDFVVCYWARIFSRSIRVEESPEEKATTWGWTVQRVSAGKNKGDWLCMYRTDDPAAVNSCRGSVSKADSSASDGPVDAAATPIVTRIPDYPDPRGKPFIVLLGLAIATYAAVWGTLFYRFQWWYQPPRALPPIGPIKEGRHKLILNYLPISFAEALATIKPESFDLIDGPESMETSLAKAARPVLVFNRFELLLRSERSANLALTGLENLLAMNDKTIILWSSTNPIFWLSTVNDLCDLSRPPEKHAQCMRWAKVLRRFDIECAPLPSQLKLTEAECDLIWDSFTPSEKLALWQIAEHGLSNPRNKPAVDQLIQRGLVAYDSTQFRVLHRDLARFASSPFTQREISSLFSSQTDSAWHGLRSVLAYSGVLAVACLLLSFGDIWESSLVHVLAVGGGFALPLLKMAYDAIPSIAKSGSKIA